MKSKPKFKVGQVVAFNINERTHFERLAWSQQIRGKIIWLTEHGYASNLFGIRPLTKRERGA